VIGRLEALLAQGQDSPNLRFAIASHWYREGEAARAIEHAQVAVTLDPDYSAAWRLLGQAQVAAGLRDAAALSFERGIAVARERGDRQAEKEMQVFLRRLNKPGGSESKPV
jgi:tetratricopeptide (TPR) repeat protein